MRSLAETTAAELPLRVAVLQSGGMGCDTAANLIALSAAAQSAKNVGATLLVTPEMFLTGYAIGHEKIRGAGRTSDRNGRAAGYGNLARKWSWDRYGLSGAK